MAKMGDIGLIGLAVMGQNLILNMNDHGYTVVAYNRTTQKVTDFLENEAKGTNVIGAFSISELCASLKRPRKIILLVKAGRPVDDFIEQLLPYLEQGDIIIDGGNSHFPDTIRREKELSSKGILFVGSGVSGGEEGARYGPSLMPGGSPDAWPHIKDIFQAIAAKTASGEACCDWVGQGGSGHYVKMVHNGIEYGDMQILCEAYSLLKNVLDLSHKEMGDIFEVWNKGELDSFLVEITRDIVRFTDADGTPLVEKIRDTAGQKGTGKWTAISALDLGSPVTLIGEAVFARCLSAIKDQRVAASKLLQGLPATSFTGDREQFIEDIRQAVYAAKIISYAQGFMELKDAASEYKWNLNYGGIALMWRGGCIIRSVFLGEITKAFKTNPNLTNLLLDPFFTSAIHRCIPSFRRVVSQAVLLGVPVPCFSSALAFYDGFRSAKLPANLLQAQRDYFGAHTYELESAPGTWIHTNWTGRGGKVSSSTYQNDPVPIPPETTESADASLINPGAEVAGSGNLTEKANGSAYDLSNESEIPISNLDSGPEIETLQLETNQPTELVQLEGNDVAKSMEMMNDLTDHTVDPYETIDDSQFVSAMTRLIESPEPIVKKDQFIFVNIETVDDKEPSFEVFSIAQDSVDLEETAQIPYLRPDSPSAIQEPEETPLAEEVKEEPLAIEEPPVVEVVEEKINRGEYIAKIKERLKEKDLLKSKNQNLQSKLVEYFRRKRADDARDTDKSAADQETRYGAYMAQVQELRKEHDELNLTNQKILADIKKKLEEKLLEVSTKTDEFVKYRKEIAKTSENARTGKVLSSKVVDQLEALENKKQKEVISARLENIKLRNKIKRYEQALRQKEELANGLHLIDFEQLKIENQTFNEKIEERNEECLKLRKKITNIVQVLTHVKEKLQFVLVLTHTNVKEENAELKNQLSTFDEQVTSYRDGLPILKAQRDNLRNKSQTIKDKNGLLGNVPLLRDFEDKMTESQALKGSIDSLKEQYAGLNKESMLLKRKMKKLEWAMSA